MNDPTRWLLVALVWIWVPVALAQSSEPETGSEEARVREEARTALSYGDFAELERLHAHYQASDQRTAAGRSKLALFRRGLNVVFVGPKGAKDAYFRQVEALTKAWAAGHPESALAHVLYADALNAHAWSYRGTGFAKTVPPDAWRDFQRHVDLAVAHLAKNSGAVLRSSSGAVTLLDLGRAAGWGRDKLWSIAEVGLTLNPADDDIYRAMLDAVLPKWNGSAVLVDRVINDLAKRTQAAHGEIYYARMYGWAADREFQNGLFADSGASWPRMKVGFQQLMLRHPAAANTNSFARFACLARDKATLLELLEQVSDKPDLDQWGPNPSRTYETCRRWAAEN